MAVRTSPIGYNARPIDRDARLFYKQKESLGEYGSGWGWDKEYAHVFDQTNNEDIPKQYLFFGTEESICINNTEHTTGEILYSQSQMEGQKSCIPNTGNAGNYYSWLAIVANSDVSGGNASNSICSKGWMLTVNEAGDKASFYSLIRFSYNVSDGEDSRVRFLPLSFIRAGSYLDGTINNRTQYGYYWSSMANGDKSAYALSHGEAYLRPQIGTYLKKYGYTIRCVGR